jgi:hypothetical protein
MQSHPHAPLTPPPHVLPSESNRLQIAGHLRTTKQNGNDPSKCLT